MNTKDAMHLARLWRVGKMIGGNEDEVRDALLARVEELESLLHRVIEWEPALPAEAALIDEIHSALMDTGVGK
jgi:uncharacterized phage protein gp47/JayE